MQIKIGKKIRALRHRDGRTQEELSNALGLTSQAVSRWESNLSYPDLEIIPKIANYFHISIDELFGYDNDRKERMDKILSDVSEMKKTQQSPEKIVQFLRVACAEFPGDAQLTFELADALMKQGWACRGTRVFSNTDDEYIHNDGTWNSDNDYLRESIRLFDILASSASDEKIKIYSKQNLVYLYKNMGKYAEAVNIANTFPEMCICKENLLYHATEGKDHCKYAQEALLASLRSINSALTTALHSRVPFGKAHSKLKIEKITGLIELYELIFDDGNMGFEHVELRDLYLFMIIDYDSLADTDDQSDNKYYTDKIFECLDKALYHSRRFDELIRSGIYKLSAYLVDHISENTDEWVASPGTSKLSESWQLFDSIKKRLSEDSRWNEWVEKTLENNDSLQRV